jgi:hypothetical protein
VNERRSQTEIIADAIVSMFERQKLSAELAEQQKAERARRRAMKKAQAARMEPAA